MDGPTGDTPVPPNAPRSTRRRPFAWAGFDRDPTITRYWTSPPRFASPFSLSVRTAPCTEHASARTARTKRGSDRRTSVKKRRTHARVDGGRFQFNFTKAVQSQFADQLEAQHEKPLAGPEAPAEPGVYVLYWKAKPVYVGSAVSGARLTSRLRQHAGKISGRRNISIDEMTCRFLATDEDWMATAAERTMIEKYHPPWQGSGFGGHVPGRGRPGTRVSQWDKWFPPRTRASEKS